jgi:hypothetical protein
MFATSLHQESVLLRRRWRADGILIASPHANETGLDNRRANLRPSDARADGAKRRLKRNNRSGYRGVSWYAPLEKWRAETNGAPRLVHRGCFVTAAAVRLNFPDERTWQEV